MFILIFLSLNETGRFLINAYSSIIMYLLVIGFVFSVEFNLTRVETRSVILYLSKLIAVLLAIMIKPLFSYIDETKYYVDKIWSPASCGRDVLKRKCCVTLTCIGYSETRKKQLFGDHKVKLRVKSIVYESGEFTGRYGGRRMPQSGILIV